MHVRVGSRIQIVAVYYICIIPDAGDDFEAEVVAAAAAVGRLLQAHSQEAGEACRQRAPSGRMRMQRLQTNKKRGKHLDELSALCEQ